jgi:H+-translocating NAD(P) transhydrogenase subunit alpha
MKSPLFALSVSLLVVFGGMLFLSQNGISCVSSLPSEGIVAMSRAEQTVDSEAKPAEVARIAQSSRSLVLVGSLTVFVLSIFVGFEIIAKVPPTLHTPLMSGSNAISGITVVGAIIAAGYKEIGVGSLLGLIAIVLAMINVVGGFLVTHRMLLMFKKR